MSSTRVARGIDGRTMTPDGVEIAFRDYGGTGADVVLLPGIGGNLEAEHETALELAHRWRIVTMDPGAGLVNPENRRRSPGPIWS